MKSNRAKTTLNILMNILSYGIPAAFALRSLSPVAAAVISKTFRINSFCDCGIFCRSNAWCSTFFKR